MTIMSGGSALAFGAPLDRVWLFGVWLARLKLGETV